MGEEMEAGVWHMLIKIVATWRVLYPREVETRCYTQFASLFLPYRDRRIRHRMSEDMIKSTKFLLHFVMLIAVLIACVCATLPVDDRTNHFAALAVAHLQFWTASDNRCDGSVICDRWPCDDMVHVGCGNYTLRLLRRLRVEFCRSLLVFGNN